MIVGSTLSGKSVAWKILQATMTRLSKGGDPNYQIVKVRISVYLIFVTASARVAIQTIRLWRWGYLFIWSLLQPQQGWRSKLSDSEGEDICLFDLCYSLRKGGDPNYQIVKVRISVYLIFVTASAKVAIQTIRLWRWGYLFIWSLLQPQEGWRSKLSDSEGEDTCLFDLCYSLSKGGDPNYQIVKVRIPVYLIFVTASARVAIQTIRLWRWGYLFIWSLLQPQQGWRSKLSDCEGEDTCLFDLCYSLSKGGDPNYQIVKVRIPVYLIFVTASARVAIQTIRLWRWGYLFIWSLLQPQQGWRSKLSDSEGYLFIWSLSLDACNQMW